MGDKAEVIINRVNRIKQFALLGTERTKYNKTDCKRLVHSIIRIKDEFDEIKKDLYLCVADMSSKKENPAQAMKFIDKLHDIY